MKKSIFLFTFFCFYSSLYLGQITFSEVLSLENKSFKEVQAFFIANYTIIEDSKQYKYQPLKECDPPEYKDDGCKWKCAKRIHDVIESKFPISQPVFENSEIKNYEYYHTMRSSFGENYDPLTKQATTFIDIFYQDGWNNANCKNELEEGAFGVEALSINIQFSNSYHWKEFKKNVTQKASFLKTKSGYNEDEIIMCYGIRRKIVNGSSKGIYIELRERGSTFYADIDTDSWIRE